jgi:hypothetical protein
MQGVTLTISAIACAMVFSLSPIYGLVVYVAACSLYPSNLVVPVGTIDFTMLRIVIIAVYAKIFFLTDLPSRFRFMWVDKLVIIYYMAQVVAGLTTTQSVGAFLENRSGAVFDMVLPYFAVRLIVIDREKYLTLLKSVFVIAAPLAIVGFYQCVTGNNPVGFFRNYGAWETGDYVYVPLSRFGLTRADVVFTHPIMYGLFFAMFGPACAGVFGYVKKSRRMLYWAALALMCMGLFSCVSSGPALAALLSIAFIGFYWHRRHWRTAIVTVVVLCTLLEIASNRHFYDVIDRFTLNSQTAWYRSRLIDVALYEGGMSGHWIAGYGYNTDPGWGATIDRRTYTDIVNEYLLILCRYGLIGLVPFFAMSIAAVKRLIYSYKVSTQDSDKWLIWCLAAALFGLAGAFISVSLHGQPTTIFYMLLGFCGAMPAIVRRPKLRPAAVRGGGSAPSDAGIKNKQLANNDVCQEP